MHLPEVGRLSLGWEWDLEGGHGALEEDGAAVRPFLQMLDEPPPQLLVWSKGNMSLLPPLLYRGLRRNPQRGKHSLPTQPA